MLSSRTNTTTNCAPHIGFFDLKKLFSFQLPVSAPVMASQDDRRRTDNPDNPNPANPGSDPASAASGIKLLIDIN